MNVTSIPGQQQPLYIATAGKVGALPGTITGRDGITYTGGVNPLTVSAGNVPAGLGFNPQATGVSSFGTPPAMNFGTPVDAATPAPANQPTTAPNVNGLLGSTGTMSGTILNQFKPEDATAAFNPDSYKNFKLTNSPLINAMIESADRAEKSTKTSIIDAMRTEHGKYQSYMAAQGLPNDFGTFMKLYTNGGLDLDGKPQPVDIDAMVKFSYAKAAYKKDNPNPNSIEGRAIANSGEQNVNRGVRAYQKALAEGKTKDQAIAAAMSLFTEADLLGTTKDQLKQKILATAGPSPVVTAQSTNASGTTGTQASGTTPPTTTTAPTATTAPTGTTATTTTTAPTGTTGSTGTKAPTTTTAPTGTTPSTGTKPPTTTTAPTGTTPSTGTKAPTTTTAPTGTKAPVPTQTIPKSA